MKRNKMVLTSVVLMVVLVVVGWNIYNAFAHRTNRWAVIEDNKGDRITMELTNDEVWNQLVELYQNKNAMWIGGIVERHNNKWGFRFKPETIKVAEITAEGLQTTIRDISKNLDYWLGLGHAYVFAKVTEIHNVGTKMQVTMQLSPETIGPGDTVTISAVVKNNAGNLIEGATVTATIGDLEILLRLSDQGNGNHQETIDTPILNEGTYEVVVTAQKEGYEPNQTSKMLTVKVTD